MTTQRDDLAEIIKPAAAFDYWPQEAARLVLAAGYTRPREITTIEELDALVGGSVVIAKLGGVWEKCISPNAWACPGDEYLYDSVELALPAIVLHEGAGA